MNLSMQMTMTTAERAGGGGLRVCIKIVAIMAISAVAFSAMIAEDSKIGLNGAFVRGRSTQSRNPDTMALESSLPHNEDNILSNSNNKSKSGQTKPNLVFHIGPPKTGTTTIQYGLHKYLADTLQLDNYYYAGKYYADVGGKPPQTDLMNSALDELFSKESKCRKEATCDCVYGFQEKLQSYLKSGQHLLFSAEGFIKHFGTSKHYQCLQERLGQDWNLVIAISYRRLYEWLPSKLYQGYRMDQANSARWKGEWPGIGNHGKEAELLFPRLYKEWQNVFDKTCYTTQALEAIQGQVKVNMLNMYNATDPDDSLTTRFVCEVLPDAEHSCAKGRALDRSHENMVTRNQGNSGLHIFYDIVVTRAVAKGVLDPSKISLTRRQVREKLRAENEVVLNQTAFDLPLDCPSKDALEEYLELSLQAERVVLGEKEASLTEASHRESFWSKANSTVWCNVDVDAVLKINHWKDFFAKLQEP